MIQWFAVAPLQCGIFELDVPTCFAFVGAVAAMVFVRVRAQSLGLSHKLAVDGIFLILLSAFVLGHVFDVVLYRREALQANWQLIFPWNGGSCSLGAGAGVVLATTLVFRTRHRQVDWRYVDEAALALLIGIAILRVGCFIGHHHAGRLSSFFLAVQYPKGPRHDLGLYEAILVVGIFVFLGVTSARNRSASTGRAGVITGFALAMYGTCRFLLEFLRGDDIERIGRHSDPRYFGLTLVQYAAVLLVAGGALLSRSVRRASNEA